MFIFGKDALFVRLGVLLSDMEATLSTAVPIRRIALYARCSTTRDQSTDAQLRELNNYCRARGWAVVEEIIDHGFSGTNANRPGLKKLLELARTRKIDTVVILKLDRLFRSLRHVVTTLQELSDLGVEFISVCDQVDMTTSAGRLMVHLLAAFAEFEANLIRERTLIGLDHAVSQGKRLGRPPRAEYSQIQELHAKGLSYRKIRKELGCSFGAITSALRSERNGVPKA